MVQCRQPDFSDIPRTTNEVYHLVNYSVVISYTIIELPHKFTEKWVFGEVGNNDFRVSPTVQFTNPLK